MAWDPLSLNATIHLPRATGFNAFSLVMRTMLLFGGPERIQAVLRVYKPVARTVHSPESQSAGAGKGGDA